MNKNKIIILIAIPILYLYLKFFQNVLIDDTFITLSYVKTLLHHGTWGMFPGYITNTATSPLNVILLTLISFITQSPVESVILLTLICFILIIVFLNNISLKVFSNDVYGYIAASFIIFNPFIISTIGLETFLFITLFIASLNAFLIKQWLYLSIALALLTLTRADGFLLFIIFLFFVPTLKIRLKLILFYALFITPWYIFSWIHLGSFVPETLMIKRWQNSWWGWGYLNGLALYFDKYFIETLLSFILLPVLFLLFIVKNKKNIPFVLLGVIGAVHFISYVILQVPPYHWYYSIEIVVIILISTFIIGSIIEDQFRILKQNKLLKSIISIIILIPALSIGYILYINGFYLKEIPIHTNWATHEQYKSVGLWLKENHPKSSILIQGEIGTLAFYSDCYLWNDFSDRRIIESNIKTNISKGGIRSLLYKLNFMFFPGNQKIPDYSYQLSILNNRNNIEQIEGTKWKTSTRWFPQSLIILTKY